MAPVPRLDQRAAPGRPHPASVPDPLWVGPPEQRFWAHRIDDGLDYEHHVSYVHINPLKHVLVERVVDWPWSSFHRFAATRSYPEDWGGTVRIPESVGRE